MGAARILLVDDDPGVLAWLHRQVSAHGHEAMRVTAGADAVARLAQEQDPFDLCLTAVRMSGVDGFAVLEAARKQRPALPVIVLVSDGAARDAVAALRAGAADFLPRPPQPELLADTIRRALGAEAGANDGPRSSEGAAVVGDHPALRLMLERIDQVAETDANVLIRGEAGTGTDVIARLVHASSGRRGGPFVSLRLTGAPEALLEAELFGYPTGAPGKIAAAAGGTLHLDEIAELPRELQGKLLRVLQQREVLPPGGRSPIAVNVRVIASTSRSLEPLVQQGAFRDDLYYRLDVIPIDVPPLRARRDDIPLLVDHLRREANARDGHQVPAFPPEVVKRLSTYDWPGNVRQLQTTVEKVVQTVGDRAVAPADLPAHLRTDVVELGVGMVDLPPYGVDLRLLLTQLEDRLIGQALERTGGNKNRAAELLGMNRTTLVEKLRRRNVA